jgi:hypothetical protein
MTWILANWHWIALGAGVLISILNAVTKHWSLVNSPWGRLLAFLVELLAVLTSAGTSIGGGPLARVKLPLQSNPPRTAAEPKTAGNVKTVGLVLLVMLCSCATWEKTTRKGLDVAFRAGVVAHKGVSAACNGGLLQECIKARTNPCPALERCKRAVDGLLAYQTGIKGAVLALDAWERLKPDLQAMGVVK